jgi:RNA 2',3'-cyclic 3'-phosphodiesterase
MARAFVAVRPPETVLDAVARVVEDLDVPNVRSTTRDQWHVTIQFLGNQADVDAVAHALSRLALRAGRVRLGGGGAFPSARRARVLWLGLSEGDEWFVQCAAAVGALLAPLGHEPEKRPFHAHLTLARAKAAMDLRRTVEQLGNSPVGDAWTAGEVVLYESRLQRSGARYEPRSTVRLDP